MLLQLTLHRSIYTGIIKFDILDHFPIFLVAETEKRMTSEEKVQTYEHEIRYKNFVNFLESIKQRTNS